MRPSGLVSSRRVSRCVATNLYGWPCTEAATPTNPRSKFTGTDWPKTLNVADATNAELQPSEVADGRKENDVNGSGAVVTSLRASTTARSSTLTKITWPSYLTGTPG